MQIPTADSFTRHDACPAIDQPLSELERRIVHLGRADADRGDRSGRGFAPLKALFAALTGVRGLQPLADARLEALRCYASATRRGDRIARALAGELRALGFSADALGTATALARR